MADLSLHTVEEYRFGPVPYSQGIQAPWTITNILPGDYDYDGRLDILLMGQEHPDGWFSDTEVKMLLYKGVGGGNFCTVGAHMIIWVKLTPCLGNCSGSDGHSIFRSAAADTVRC